MNIFRFSLCSGVACALIGCSVQPGQVKKVLLDNPEIVAEVMEKHPDKFLPALEKLSDYARKAGAERQQNEMKSKLEEDIKNPKKPVISEERAIRGNPKSPIMIVEYSDFQCPYCKMGFTTVEAVREKYGDKVAVLYKHLPLNFHPFAMPSAKRFEAIALQDKNMAYKFHDYVFQNQGEFQGKNQAQGEKFLDEAAKKVGANFGRMKKDMDGEEVKKRIEADMQEAKGFGIEGTPGFNVNGVMIRGALPVDFFDQVISRTTQANAK